MRSSVVVAVGVFMAVFITGCDPDITDSGSVRGSGVVTTEKRPVSGFDEVAVLGFGTLEIDISGEDSLEIEAEDNLMQYLTSDVRGNLLELGIRDDVSLSPTEPVIYRITAANLNEITILGSANVTTSRIDSDSFRLTINGSGDVELLGSVADLEVVINGSGDLDGDRLVAEAASININGSGNAVVNATTSLEARIAGSGDIEYIGDPQLSVSVTGSGRVSQR